MSFDDDNEILLIIILFAILISLPSVFLDFQNTLQVVEEQGIMNETTVADVIRMTMGIEGGDPNGIFGSLY